MGGCRGSGSSAANYMMVFKVGDKARVAHMPPAGICHVGKLVTVLHLGGAFVFDDDALVETEDGVRFMVTEDQLTGTGFCPE
jgi:hypothetical protein